MRFRQWGSRTPGHPEYGHTPGVETTTGPLGQGAANAIGMAIAGKHFEAAYGPDAGFRVYAIVTDGDLMEGVSGEASSLAGHLGLDNLVFLYDDNHVTIDGNTELAFTEDRRRRYDACGWHTSTVDRRQRPGGDRHRASSDALSVAGQPSMISVKTIIGFGSRATPAPRGRTPTPVERSSRPRPSVRSGSTPSSSSSSRTRRWSATAGRCARRGAAAGDGGSGWRRIPSATSSSASTRHRAGRRRDLPVRPERRPDGHPRRIRQGDRRAGAADPGAGRRLCRPDAVQQHPAGGLDRLPARQPRRPLPPVRRPRARHGRRRQRPGRCRGLRAYGAPSSTSSTT